MQLSIFVFVLFKLIYCRTLKNSQTHVLSHWMVLC